MLTQDRRNEIRTRARAAIDQRTLRRDAWWAYPFTLAVFLTVFIGYSTWAGLLKTGYYSDPYISPIFSPCLAANCAKATFRLVGEWWFLSPALLVIVLPVGFRVTCYYYRKAYYRAFSFAPNFVPPACGARDPNYPSPSRTRFPFRV